MPKAKEDEITDREIQFAHFVLSGTMTDAQAAVDAGFTAAMAPHVKARPRVVAYMSQHRSAVREGLVAHEVDALSKYNITRESVLGKYWEFVNIDPQLTNYNTTSQARALDSIREMLGFGPEEPKRGEDDPGDVNVYRAAWMDKKPDVYSPTWTEAQPDQQSGTDGATTLASTPIQPALAQRLAEHEKRILAPVPVMRSPKPDTNIAYSIGPGGRASWVPGAN